MAMNNPLYQSILALCQKELDGLAPRERIQQLAEGYTDHIMFALEKFRVGCITHDDSDILDADLDAAIEEEEADRLNYSIFRKIKQSLERLKK